MGNVLHGSTGFSEVSTIECMNDPKNVLRLRSFLPSDFTGLQLRFDLLYRGSRDGMTAAAFHRLCDGSDDTVSVIKDADGNVFGGFADEAWRTQSSYVKSKESFLFSLKSSLGSEPDKFSVYSGDPHALRHGTSILCGFGNGDLNVLPGHLSSTINIGTSYHNPSTAYSRQYCTCGQQNFKLHEVEVYEIVLPHPVKVNADELPISLASLTKTDDQLHLKSISDLLKESNIYTTQTSDLASSLLHMAKVVQMAEEELLLELMWIEHLSVPMSKRNLSAGLLAEWERICEESADVLPLSNRVVMTSCESAILKRVEESIARLHIEVGSKRKRDSGRIQQHLLQ